MNDLRFRRDARLSVRGWLLENRSAISELPYILISSMDSDREVAAMPWARARQQDPAWAISLHPLVLSGQSVIELLSDPELFTGFDELWVPATLPVEQPPGDAYLVGPQQLDSDSPEAIGRWIRASHCRLGVGDGDGMNYVVSDSKLALALGLD